MSRHSFSVLVHPPVPQISEVLFGRIHAEVYLSTLTPNYLNHLAIVDGSQMDSYPRAVENFFLYSKQFMNPLLMKFYIPLADAMETH